MAGERIRDLNMTMTDVIKELSRHESGGYNPGAAAVLVEILTKGTEIDPDSMTPILNILSFDTHHIYAERIWMLYKDVCGQDIAKTMGMLRAVQLGFLGETELNHAIDNYGRGLDVPGVMVKVKERLPRFGGFTSQQVQDQRL